MKFFSFSRRVIVRTDIIGQQNKPSIHMIADPGVRYVFTDDDANQIMGENIWKCPDAKCLTLNGKDDNTCRMCGHLKPPPPPIWDEVTDFWPYYLDAMKRAGRSQPTNFRDKHILLFRSRGGGDQLISSAISRFLTEQLRARCFQISSKLNELFWAGNPYIHGSAVLFPLELDSLVRFKGRPFYDWFYSFESLSEFDTTVEQSNVYDRQFAMMGIDPSKVPDKYKRPFFAITEQDMVEMGDLRGRSYIAFQLRATNISRTIPPRIIDLVLGELNKIGMAVLCLDDVDLSPEVANIVASHENAVDFSRATRDNVRKYGTIICNAALVVGPDSSGIHFAASHDVPTVSLWGSFDPDSRVKYYANHTALWFPENQCQNSPCFNYKEKLPVHKCPEGSAAKYCKAMDGITKEKFAAAVEKQLSGRRLTPSVMISGHL